jgi:hypothetical protein
MVLEKCQRHDQRQQPLAVVLDEVQKLLVAALPRQGHRTVL